MAHSFLIPKFVLLFHFPAFVLLAQKSQRWGGSLHNNVPRRYLCFNWLCLEELSGSQPKQFIHMEFLARPCYFTPLFWKLNGAASFITAGSVANIFFGRGGELVYNSCYHLVVSHINNSTTNHYSGYLVMMTVIMKIMVIYFLQSHRVQPWD